MADGVYAGAQLHDIAQGGIALMNGQGWFHRTVQTGMESAWDKVYYNTMLGEMTRWDFSGYVPQVVIVALGQNDNYPVDYMKVESEVQRDQARVCDDSAVVERDRSYCCEMVDKWWIILKMCWGYSQKNYEYELYFAESRERRTGRDLRAL